MGSQIITFITVSYNSSLTIENCLRSVLKQPRSEIIVVDNNSTDNTAELVQKFKTVKFLPQPRNLGFNGGNQIGIDAAKGNILVFLNPDTIVPANFTEIIEQELNANPKVGILGCQIKDIEGNLQPTCDAFPTLGSLLWQYSGYNILFPRSKAYKHYRIDGWDRTTPRLVDAVSGACTIVRREVLEQIGGLDTGFFLFFEEFDLSQRAKKLGWEVLFSPAVAVSHVQGVSTKQLNGELIERTYRQSRDRYIIKYHGFLFWVSFVVLAWIFTKLSAIKLRIFTSSRSI